MRKKEESKERQHLGCPQGDDGNHIACQEEGGQHPKDDCITTMLPSAASEKKWKINDEKQHLWQPQQGEGVGDQM